MVRSKQPGTELRTVQRPAAAARLHDRYRRARALAARCLERAIEDRMVFWPGLVLVALDFGFLGIALLGKAAGRFPSLASFVDGLGLRDPFLQIELDGSLPEIYGYAKTAAAAALLLLLGRRDRQPVYPALAFVFLVILADDALRIHEAVGDHVARSVPWQTAFRLRPDDFGEASVFAAWLIILIAAAAFGMRRSGRTHRDAGILFLAVIGILAFFGGVVDLAGIVIGISGWWAAGVLLGLLDDAGELAALSLGLLLAWTLWRHPALCGKPAPSADAPAPERAPCADRP